MQDIGLITNFWTEINSFKLGYDVYRIYINFQDVSLDTKDEIIEYFANCNNAWAVQSIKGPIDLDVYLWVKDSNKFEKFWNITLEKYGSYFAKYTISIFTGGIACKKSYLLTDKYDKSNREFFEFKSGGKTIEIGEIDYNLLNELAENARVPLIELAAKLGYSSQNVNYKIKNLIKKDVIKAFRVGIEISKLGLQYYKYNIYLKKHSQRKMIMDYLKGNPHVENIIFAIGWCDLQLEINVKNVEHLSQIMEDIEINFPDAIRKQSFWITSKYHRLRSLPELEFK